MVQNNNSNNKKTNMIWAGVIAASIAFILLISLILIFKFQHTNNKQNTQNSNKLVLTKENKNRVENAIDIFEQQRTDKDISSLVVARNIDVFYFNDKNEDKIAKVLAYQNYSEGAKLTSYLEYINGFGSGSAYFEKGSDITGYDVVLKYDNNPEKRFSTLDKEGPQKNNIKIFEYLIENKANLVQGKDNLMYLNELSEDFTYCINLFAQFSAARSRYSATKLALYVDDNELLNILVYAKDTENNLENIQCSRLKFYGAQEHREDRLANIQDQRLYKGISYLNFALVKAVKAHYSDYVGFTKLDININKGILASTTPTQKEYDGTKTLDVMLDNNYINENIKNSPEKLFLKVEAKAEFSDSQVGNDKDITYTFKLTGVGSEYYNLVYSDIKNKGNITPKNVVFEAEFKNTSYTKVFDNTVNANVKFSNDTTQINVAKSKIISSDEVRYNIESAVYDNKNVGENKKITITLSLAGTNAANYNLTNKTVEINEGKITKGNLTFTLEAVSREYEKDNKNVVVNVKDVNIAGLELTATGVMENDQVGDNKTVTVTINGIESENYSYTMPTDVKVSITKAKVRYNLVAQPRPIDPSNDKVVLKAVLETPNSEINIIDGEGTVENADSTDSQKVTITTDVKLDPSLEANYELVRINEGDINVQLTPATVS